jgi:PAS domain S-box-containing protein
MAKMGRRRAGTQTRKKMNSLLTRLLLIVAVALIPALCFQAYSENEARQLRQQFMEDQALDLVRFVSAEQRRIVEGAEAVLDVIGSAPSVQENRLDVCQRLATNVLAQSPRYDNLGILDLDGHPICAPEPFDHTIDLSARTYFRLALQTGGVAIGEYLAGQRLGKPTIHIAKPFKNRDGVVAGVVALSLNLEWLGQQLQGLPLPPGATAIIADRDGVTLARYPEGARGAGQPMSAANRFLLEGYKIGVADIIGRDGRPRLAGYAPVGVGPNGWFVAVSLDRETAFAAVTRANRAGLLLIVAGAGLSLALTALLGARLIRRPVTQLLAVAAHWRTGDLAARTGLHQDRGEFGRLAVAFDDMAEALEARETALRDALESTTDMVIVLDRAWRYTYLNERAKTQFAHGRDLVGQVIWSAFPAAASNAFGDVCRKAMDTGLPAHAGTYYAPLASHWDVHAYPSHDGLTVFTRDVTEQQRIAQALRNSEQRLRLALEAARLGVLELDLVTGEGSWPPETLNIFGCVAGSDLTFDRWFAAIHPDDQGSARASLDRAFSSPGHHHEAEYRFRQPDGTWRWIAAHARIVFEAGRAVREIGVVQDISARKHDQEALRQSETRLQLAREAANLGIWDWDAASGKQLWSEQQWRVYGLEPQPGAPDFETFRDCIHTADLRQVLDARADAFAAGSELADIEYRVVWPDGSLHWLLGKTKLLRDSDGKVVRAVGVTLDVTASRQTEAVLRDLADELVARVQEETAAREAAQLRAAHAERMQALGQLSGGIAHDFNNVLQAISGALTLIARRPDDHAGVRRMAQLAGEATERGASITRRLLAFGRRGDLRAVTIDPATLLNDLREILTHTLGTNIDVQVRVETGLGQFLADKAQLETSLINLATNARDAMPNGGELILSAAVETVAASAPGHSDGIDPGRYLRLTIEDTGIGMDATTLARASEPFFTTKKVGAGTGLGLAMAKGFAEQSGGGMRIESIPGKGTTITLWFPETDPNAITATAAPQVWAATAASAKYDTTAPSRVLLVDDEAPLREVLALQLEDAGFAVLSAASGTEALALLATGERIDALITDLSMPGMDGLAVIRSVQERHPHLPAILLTGYAGDGATLAVGGAVSGAFSLLRKPVSGIALIDRLRALLAARPEASRDGAKDRVAADEAGRVN